MLKLFVFSVFLSLSFQLFAQKIDTSYNKAFEQMVNNRFNSAIVNFKLSIKNDSTYAPAWFNLAYSYMMFDMRDSALTAISKAEALFPDSSSKAASFTLMGMIYEEQNKNTLAEDNFNKSLILRPNDKGTLLELADLYSKTNQSNKLILTSETIFFRNTTDTVVVFNLIESYFSWKRYKQLDQFISEMHHSYKKEPKVLGYLYFALAQNYQKNKMNKQAKKNFNLARKFFMEFLPQRDPIFKIIDLNLSRL